MQFLLQRHNVKKSNTFLGIKESFKSIVITYWSRCLKGAFPRTFPRPPSGSTCLNVTGHPVWTGPNIIPLKSGQRGLFSDQSPRLLRLCCGPTWDASADGEEAEQGHGEEQRRRAATASFLRPQQQQQQHHLGLLWGYHQGPVPSFPITRLNASVFLLLLGFFARRLQCKARGAVSRSGRTEGRSVLTVRAVIRHNYR